MVSISIGSCVPSEVPKLVFSAVVWCHKEAAQHVTFGWEICFSPPNHKRGRRILAASKSKKIIAGCQMATRSARRERCESGKVFDQSVSYNGGDASSSQGVLSRIGRNLLVV